MKVQLVLMHIVSKNRWENCNTEWGSTDNDPSGCGRWTLCWCLHAAIQNDNYNHSNINYQQWITRVGINWCLH